MGIRIQIRRDLAANWVSTNPVLLEGEQGLETDTGKVKIGDGSTTWNALSYNSDGIDWTGANTDFSTTGSVDATSAFFDGSSDQVQLTVQGHTTQTAEIFVVETSAGTDVFSVSNAGNVTVSGTVDGRDLATDGAKLDGIEAGATADQTAGEIEAIVNHDNLLGFVANEHIDWTSTTSNLSTSGTAATGALTVTGNIGVTGTVDGRDIATDGSKLDGIEAGADVTDQANVTAALAGGTVAGTVLIDGAADAVQFTVQGNATQTNDIFIVENSAGTDLFTIDNSGNTAITGFLGVGASPSVPFEVQYNLDTYAVLRTTGAAANVGFTYENSNDSNDSWRVYRHNGGTFRIGYSSAQPFGAESAYLYINQSGAIGTGNETAPDVSAGGLCLNQGTADTEILTFKSSDVAHGITTVNETDTYAAFLKPSGIEGGLRVRGLSEGTTALATETYATTEDTTDASTSGANTVFQARLKSGTGSTDHGATANMFAWKNNNVTHMILKGNGDLHISNTTLTALDDENDLALARDFQMATGGAHYKHKVSAEGLERLKQLGILSSDENLINAQGAQALTLGAISQLANVLGFLADKLGISKDELLKEAQNYNNTLTY